MNHFMPHGHCYLWTPEILWPIVISDFLLGLCYTAIPVMLTVVVIRDKEFRFTKPFLAFSAFIFACGLTHFLDVYNVWNTAYELSSYLRPVAALASCYAVWVLLTELLRPIVKSSEDEIIKRQQEIIEQLTKLLGGK